MAKLPVVAIIGRPNTGKSTLFNRILGRRKAIVSEVPGTTRDHIASLIETDDVDFLLLDTGGMGGGTDDKDFEDDVHKQSILALENADIILFTINSTEELTKNDYQIVDILRRQRRNHVPVIVVPTKCDNPEVLDSILPEYHQLGITDDIIPISAIHKIGMDDLLHRIQTKLEELNFQKTEKEDSGAPARIAIIGKPNVGKSSLINAYMSDAQRTVSPLLVSDIPGTTRDSVDTIIRSEGREYLFVDTAGIRRRKNTAEGIETFAFFRSIRALHTSDICVMVIDASEPISKQDKRIAGMAVEGGRGLIILANKADLLTGDQKKALRDFVKMSLPFCKFAPVLPVSATKRDGLLKLFPLIDMVHTNRTRRVPTKELLDWYKDALYGKPMSSLLSGKLITQTSSVPPTFALFVKDPNMVKPSQMRYLENNIRKHYAFEGAPIRWILKGKNEE